jgi:hypothetical protein
MAQYKCQRERSLASFQVNISSIQACLREDQMKHEITSEATEQQSKRSSPPDIFCLSEVFPMLRVALAAFT